MVLPSIVLATAISLFATAIQVAAESHEIVFVNDCGRGNPLLISQSGETLSTGASFTIDGPLVGAISFLQTGNCGDAGENCTVVDITLRNPISPGGGSAVDINLIPPHAFSVPTGFGYFNGCDGAGEDCTTPNCPRPGQPPGPGPFPVSCQANNVNLAVTFCD